LIWPRKRGAETAARRDLLHLYEPWVLLIAGSLGLLNATLFYRAQQRCAQKLLASEAAQRLVFAPVQRMIGGKWLQGLFERLLQSSMLRWLGVVQSILFIAGGAVWFALQP
jgi:hypothetical protein